MVPELLELSVPKALRWFRPLLVLERHCAAQARTSCSLLGLEQDQTELSERLPLRPEPTDFQIQKDPPELVRRVEPAPKENEAFPMPSRLDESP